jgi:hypothetical protein
MRDPALALDVKEFRMERSPEHQEAVRLQGGQFD